MRRSTRSPRRRAASGTRGRRGLSGSPRPPLPRNLAQSTESRLELVLTRAVEPVAEHRQQLGAGSARDEDDELEPEPPLVLLVQPGQLVEHLRLGAALLLGGLADARMRHKSRDLVGLWQRQRDLLGDAERVLAAGQLVDEPRAAREERGQLLDAQLPR